MQNYKKNQSFASLKNSIAVIHNFLLLLQTNHFTKYFYGTKNNRQNNY